MLAQGTEGWFLLAEPGSMAKIEQPVNLRQVPVRPRRRASSALLTLAVGIAVWRASLASINTGRVGGFS
jgi:hypothetical protein